MTRALRALGIIAVLTLVTALLGTGSASAGDTEPDPLAGAPAVGDCYDLTIRQAYGHSSPEQPVSCAGRHTMVVTAVGTIPSSIDWATFDWDKKFPAALSRALDDVCDPAVRKLLGTDTARALTLYEDYFFSPAAADVEAGARWFSCEVAVQASTKLLPFPKGQPAKVGASTPDSVRRCAKNAKGSFTTVPCSQPHQWRSTFAKLVHRKLTENTMRAAAKKTCPRRVSSERWLYFANYVSTSSFVIGCTSETRR